MINDEDALLEIRARAIGWTSNLICLTLKSAALVFHHCAFELHKTSWFTEDAKLSSFIV